MSETLRFSLAGRAVELREEAGDAAHGADGRLPDLLLLAIDGVDRDLLYRMLEEGRLPETAAAIGMRPGASRAHLEPSLVTSLPSSTAVAWATAITGADPADHGIVGNEFFLRDERRLVAPVPASVDDPSDVLATYSEGLVNDLLLHPTVYEQLRELEPEVRIWVAMHQVFGGADLLLMPDRRTLLDAMRVMVQERVRAQIGDDDAFGVYEELDRGIVSAVLHELEKQEPPDVLTVYLPGTDLFAHTASSGPDVGRERYLREAVDPLIGELVAELRERGALEDRWIVITSDHGHTQVVHRDHQSLGVDDSGEPGQVLRRAGFRLRPFELGATDEGADDFDVVITYQGGLAYVYLADRSTCLEAEAHCDWSREPRFEADVLAAADAFYRTSEDGLHASELIDSLEMVLVRRPSASAGAPFRVYAGEGRLEEVRDHLREHPRPNWIDFEPRLRALAEGPGASRLGDLVLVSRAGDEWPVDQRRYFAPPYRSYHGSPASKDSRIPLIVAHPRHSSAEAERRVAEVMREGTDPSRVAHLLVSLRRGAAGTAEAR